MNSFAAPILDSSRVFTYSPSSPISDLRHELPIGLSFYQRSPPHLRLSRTISPSSSSPLIVSNILLRFPPSPDQPAYGAGLQEMRKRVLVDIFVSDMNRCAMYFLYLYFSSIIVEVDNPALEDLHM